MPVTSPLPTQGGGDVSFLSGIIEQNLGRTRNSPSGSDWNAGLSVSALGGTAYPNNLSRVHTWTWVIPTIGEGRPPRAASTTATVRIYFQFPIVVTAMSGQTINWQVEAQPMSIGSIFSATKVNIPVTTTLTGNAASLETSTEDIVIPAVNFDGFDIFAFDLRRFGNTDTVLDGIDVTTVSVLYTAA